MLMKTDSKPSIRKLAQLIILLSLVAINACSTTVSNEKQLHESAQSQTTADKIDSYFAILSKISNYNWTSSFEMSRYQIDAVTQLDNKFDIRYIAKFIDALDHDSPIIRSIAIKQIKYHYYKPAIAKLITIMNSDSIDENREDAIKALAWIKASSACPAIEALTLQPDGRPQLEVFEAMIEIPCSSVTPLLLAYFKKDTFKRFVGNFRVLFLSVVAKTKSAAFVPYLTTMIYRNGKADSTILSTIKKIGGQQVEDFFSAELKKIGTADNKQVLVRKMLKMNTHTMDTQVMDYIDRIQDSEVRRLVYAASKAAFNEPKRRKHFVGRLLKNYEQEKNNKIKQKITTMLEGVIDKKHIEKIQVLINNEKDQENKCRLVRDLSQIATNKQYDFLIQFDSLGQSSTCYKPVIIYLGNLKNDKANNYLLSKYDVKTDKKILYLRAVGQYKSKKNRELLFDLLNSKNAGLRYVAAKGLPNQSILNDWGMINAIYTKERDKEVAEKLLYIIATFNHKESLDIIKQAYSTRLYSTARKILEKKGFTNEQILALRNKNKK